MRPPTTQLALEDKRRWWFWGLLIAISTVGLGGCDSGGAIYDPDALAGAERIAVMPAIGAPGGEGLRVGPPQTGILLGALSKLNAYHIEGPGRIRKAFQAVSDAPGGIWSRELQARLADDLDIDLLALCDVTDYRFWKTWHTADWVVGQTHYTVTTWRATVRVRLIHPDDGRLVYCHEAQADSQQGFGPALLEANRKVLEPLQQFLRTQKKQNP